ACTWKGARWTSASPACRSRGFATPPSPCGPEASATTPARTSCTSTPGACGAGADRRAARRKPPSGPSRGGLSAADDRRRHHSIQLAIESVEIGQEPDHSVLARLGGGVEDDHRDRRRDPCHAQVAAL